MLKNLLNTLKSLHSLIFRSLEKTTFMLLLETLYETLKKADWYKLKKSKTWGLFQNLVRT